MDWKFNSQYGEAEFLDNYFQKNKPVYKIAVDVGAKGMTLSNTYDLIKNRDWSGVLFEPENTNYKELVELYKGVARVKIFNIAISNKSGFGYLYIHELKGHHSLTRKSDKTQVVRLHTLPDILRTNKVPKDFDLLSVDAEGEDYAIIEFIFYKSFYRPKLIVCEIGKRNCPFDSLFKDFKYNLIYRTEGNLIYEYKSGS